MADRPFRPSRDDPDAYDFAREEVDMQAVLDFYVGFAWFMLIGSLTGLAILVLQPVFDRFRKARPRQGGIVPRYGSEPGSGLMGRRQMV